jgi:glycosyltransferase involved in cell wall biosynthesis
MNRLLIISHDVVGERMAGPGIRYLQLAKVLCQHAQTTLAIPFDPPNAQTQPTAPEFEQNLGGNIAIVHYSRRNWPSIAPYIQQNDICLFPSDIANNFPELAQSDRYLIVDGYDPLLIEWLTLTIDLPLEQHIVHWRTRMSELSQQYRLGDLYLCASERQRSWWIGLLEAQGRINPATLRQDPSLRKLIDVAPYGLPTTPPPPPKSVIKGVWPGVNRQDHLLLWGGGLWPWLDPLTAIRALTLVRQQRNDVKLIFPGSKHPNPAMAGVQTRNVEALALAQELGLLENAVFFGDWMPYRDWPHVLQECSLALSLHFDTLETHLAFRSRVLEYIWAGLPIVATRGDATSELVQQYGLGEVTNYGDVAGVASAILRLLDVGADWRNNPPAGLRQARHNLSWEEAAAPIIRFCRQPWHAPDKGRAISPILVDEVTYEQLRKERDAWRALAEGYANGRIMRFLTWLQRSIATIRK